MTELRVFPIVGVGELRPGDNVAATLDAALRVSGQALIDGDVVVVTSKIVSKAEGRLVELSTVAPSERALVLSAISQRDPRLVELALQESAEILRNERGVLISETRHGFVCANAGVDASNLASPTQAALLPIDPDASAVAIRSALMAAYGLSRLGIVISDTFGRAWRHGQTNVAIGVAGMAPIHDYRGQTDSAGLTLVVTEIAVADELAGAAELVMGKLDRVPAAVVRGYGFETVDGTARALVRPKHMDFFR
jgi:coenzyme F420-0:L-glutamate ligase/coenzyme F420-1:gamma-L-glutamate ligase